MNKTSREGFTQLRIFFRSIFSVKDLWSLYPLFLRGIVVLVFTKSDG